MLLRKFQNTFYKLAKNINGATAIEYALIAALIAVVCVITIRAVGVDVAAMFESVSEEGF